MQHTEQEIIEHCAKLLWGYNWILCNREDENVEKYSYDNDSYYLPNSYYLPKGLTDEDKFLYILLSLSAFSYSLEAKTFMLLFGWTKYKTRKIRKTFPFIRTIACLCADTGGYCGKAWVFTHKFLQDIKELQKLNKPCLSCAIFKKHCYGDPHYKCPASKEFAYFSESDHCFRIKLEVTEEFNNFWR